MSQSTCTVDGCTKPIKRYGYCYGHYMKNWRYGTPTPQHKPKWMNLIGQRFGTLTVTSERLGRFWICKCDCGETARRDTGNLRRTGETSTCGTVGNHYVTDVPAYGSAHDRVKHLHGSASSHQCTDCEKNAYHWSYDHMDPEEMFYEYAPGKHAAYSAKPEHYTPRCVSCHKRYDLGRANAMQAG